MNKNDWTAIRYLLRVSLDLEPPGRGKSILQNTGPEFCKYAADQGLGLLLAWAANRAGCAPTGPTAENLSQIAAVQHDHLVRANVAAAQAIRMLRQMEIPTLAVKGLVTARAWPQPMLRVMSDVDFLIPWEDRFRFWKNSEKWREIRLNTGISTEAEPCHHDISAGGTIPFSFTELFKRGIPMTIAGEEVNGAGWEDSLLFTAGSALRKDIRSPRLIMDAVFLCHQPGFNPAQTLQRARELGLDKALLLLLRQAEYYIGTVNPFHSLKTSPIWAGNLFLGLKKNPAMPPARAFPASGISRWFLRLLCEPSLRTIRRGVNTFLPPPIALCHRHKTPLLTGLPLIRLYLRHWCGFLGKLIPLR